MTFGESMRQARRDLNMTLPELAREVMEPGATAERLRDTTSTLRAWETGQRKPGARAVRLVIAVCDELGLDVEDYDLWGAGLVAVGSVVREARLGKGLTQHELGAAIGASQTDVSAIENGRKSVGPKRAARLERALGLGRRTIERLARRNR